MINIAIFASGSGSNAENIANYFKDHSDIKVKLIVTNNPKAFVLERAKKLGIETLKFNRDEFYNSEKLVDQLKSQEIHFLVLAGFMWLVPAYLVKAYPQQIVNIHPALLPKFGGKGMYGDHVHNAVAAAGEKETGITIHYVNERYDEGDIIFQAKCNVENLNPDQIAEQVHQLEYKHYPKVIEMCVEDLI
ncbi:MAG TPA: phosphoribosylglycinamide formyltransferase [Fulvivirga sp.]|nr:phosphoribosylglycinamide formyltransferase [Fulvivirga sp.]